MRHPPAMAKKIRVKGERDFAACIYFIERDKKSDKKYQQIDSNTLVVNTPTVDLLQEIGLSFVEEDYSLDPIT